METEPSLKHSSLPLTRCSCAGFAVRSVSTVTVRWMWTWEGTDKSLLGDGSWDSVLPHRVRPWWFCRKHGNGGTLKIKCPQRSLTWELIKHPPLHLSIFPLIVGASCKAVSLLRGNIWRWEGFTYFRWVCNPGRHGWNQYPLTGSQRCLS